MLTATLYSSPEIYGDLLHYAEALQTVETALLSGFFYPHYVLASSILGKYH
jgi:hypothetical protein